MKGGPGTNFDLETDYRQVSVVFLSINTGIVLLPSTSWQYITPLSSLHPMFLFQLLKKLRYINHREPGSSGSIVSDYGLDDKAIGVRFRTEVKRFFL
jgi:hypothetical protein